MSKKKHLVFTIRNSIHPDYPSLEEGGAGLSAARQRLQLVYPGRHRLTVEAANSFLIKLELDL